MKIAAAAVFAVVCLISGYVARPIEGADGLFLAIGPAIGWLLACVK